MNRRIPCACAIVLTVLLSIASSTRAQNIDAKEYRLDNGMQVLMVEKHESPTIMAAIFARVGSSNEVTGITGISHLFEHMMFKGTETIGTKDMTRDREIMAQLDSLRELMRSEENVMRTEYRHGEITDMLDQDAKTPRYREIEKVFDSLILEQRQLIIKDQLDELYTKNGGSFLNAFTSQDMTAYFVRLPRNKIELYMWLESDRFSHPVFREFYSERNVVREERRLGVESTPTGLIEEDFQAMFWKSSSYHWDVIGWPSDLGSITREQANNYYATYYAPNNLSMILVGDLNPDEMITMVKKYFERIPRGTTPPPEVVTLEEKQYGEKRLIAEAEASPQTSIAYHTVAFKNADSYPLEVLAGIMSGKTGRLYKKLVDEKGIAKGSMSGGGRGMGGGRLAVSASQDSRRFAGMFSIDAEGTSGVKAEDLEQAIYEVIEDLKVNPVPDMELQKVKNQMKVDIIRSMDRMAGIGILFYLGQNAAMGDWREANVDPQKCDAVTADDIMRVANKYFANDQRNVMIINTKATRGDTAEEAEDPQFAQFKQMILSVKDPARLEQMIGMFSSQMDQVTDPAQKEQMTKLLKIASDHLKELKAAQEM